MPADIHAESRIHVRTIPIIVPKMLARTLRVARRRYKLTVREAAKLAGVSAATYSRVERHHAPDAQTLILLSSFVLALRRRDAGRKS